MRILYITAISPPYPPTNGGRQRSNLLFRALLALGEVDLVVCGGRVDEDGAAEMARSYGLIGVIQPRLRSEVYPWKLFRWIHPKFVKRIAHNFGRRLVDYRPDPKVQRWFAANVNLDRYDVIVGRYLRSLTKPGLLGRANLVLDLDDLDTEVYRSRLNVPDLKTWERLAIKHHIRQLDKIIPNALARIPNIWVANENDRDRPGLNGAPVLPNIPYCFAGQAPVQPFDDQGSSKQVLMVGSWTHRPNTDGLLYFLEQIWPRIRADVPDAEFNVVGGGMRESDSDKVKQIPGVNLLGFVDRVEPWYQICAFSVAPIYDGGGTNIKVVESLAYGRTCVVTPKSHLGFERTLPDRKALLVSKDADAFWRNCTTLLKTPELRQRLSRAGHEAVMRSYSLKHYQETVREMLERVAASDGQGHDAGAKGIQ